MCVGFWTTNHPEYAFIILNNRDEFFSRPTIPAAVHHFGGKCHEEGDNIISGLDVTAGGTWLGINRHGRIAMLTNITEEARKHNTSRGNLVSDFLMSSTKETMEQHVEKLTRTAITEEDRAANMDYAGFNLLLISVASEDDAPEPIIKNSSVRRPRMALVTNGGGGGVLNARLLDESETCLHGVSNGVDGQTMHLWTKVQEGEDALRAAIQAPYKGEEEFIEQLFTLLARHPKEGSKSKEDLRGALRVEPIPLHLSGTFHGWYGTRVSSVILIRHDGSVVFRERDIWSLNAVGEPTLGDPKNDRKLTFWLYLMKKQARCRYQPPWAPCSLGVILLLDRTSTMGEIERDLSKPISVLLREGTAKAHETVEHAPGAAWLARGDLERFEYVRFLMMLWHVYSALEDGIKKHKESLVLAPTYRPEVLGRAEPLSLDIEYILGTPDWRAHPIHVQLEKTAPKPLTTYVNRLRHLGADGPDSRLLLAHAYVRYLGDLSGGQIIRKRIAKSYEFPKNGNGVRFYTFYEGTGEPEAGPSAMKTMKEWFRAGMDAGVGDDEKLKTTLVDEAILAFQLNQGLFTALRVPRWAEMSSPDKFELGVSEPPTPVTLLPPKSVLNSPHLIKEAQASFLSRYLLITTGLALLAFLELARRDFHF